MRPKRPRSLPLNTATRRRIDAALAANDIAAAARLADAALRQGMRDPMVLNLVAWRREEAADFSGAHRLLAEALTLAPGDPFVTGAIGAVLRKEGRLDEALTLLDRTLAAAPAHAAAWLERGYVLDLRHETAAARDSFLHALALDHTLAPALGKLADAAARAGDFDAARDYGTRALALDPAEPNATAALAQLELEAGHPVAAETRLRALLQAGAREDERTRALTMLGDALDRQGRADKAWVSWTAAQANFRTRYAAVIAPAVDRPSHRYFVERIAAQVAAAPPPTTPVPTACAEAAATHVFLVGYPRSGTTLVENVLASAPGVVALEERDTLIDSEGLLLGNDGTMPDLDALDPALVQRLRAAYWQRVTQMAGPVAGSTFVDMNPIGGARLPIIARLFPAARILLMRRDPRDVVLSCYRINFAPSTLAWAFSDLDEAARHYDAMMRLTELCRERLPLAFCDVRYDRLVSNFEPTVRTVAEFVGLRWTDEFRRFDKTAQTRGVRTASATQVRRGLYDGRGQWRRYAAQLAPALPILAPWVERFGFEP